MARIRTIKPEFWTSEQVAECSTNARLLFVGLWNFCDDAGRHQASCRRVLMEVFPGDPFSVEQVAGWIAELVAAGLLIEYEAQGKAYWQVTGWHHQKIDRPTVRHPGPEFDEHSTNDQRALDDRSPPEGKGGEGRLKEGKIKTSIDRLGPSDREAVARIASEVETALARKAHGGSLRPINGKLSPENKSTLLMAGTLVHRELLPRGRLDEIVADTAGSQKQKPLAYLRTCLVNACKDGDIPFHEIERQLKEGKNGTPDT